MIRYTLTCADGHRFDSWFQSADAFDSLRASGMIVCATCGSDRVEKSLMAPSVSTERTPPAPAPDRPLARTKGPAEQALAELKRKIETQSDYVGPKFAQEARDMHDGLIPHRPIHGEARLDEAKKLVEDGVPVAPLPFPPGRKTN
ncbi:hypothetical protein SAMN05444722_1743 [Rhodovulum sp. ES.010]|uniref:DUF1178 family protein n=1 Tax=Rhodovulum sp. ES.010 TaxID=1882821 RepID=UPI0009286B2D|nr:DUF1178 family protein [Rhodovulum sp. ES.010]SIO37442.1 hypothetical protein SAMN05444722_1743 [Rhodovulum sp. ES.010]